MDTETKCKLIGEETLKALIRTNMEQSHMILLLSYLIDRARLVTSLTEDEAVGVLKLNPRQLRDARSHCQIRAVKIGTIWVYSAYELVMMVSRLRMRKVYGLLKTIPTVYRQSGE